MGAEIIGYVRVDECNRLLLPRYVFDKEKNAARWGDRVIPIFKSEAEDNDE